MKRVIIVHGWRGYPEKGWFPWLKRELEKKGFEVKIPQLPLDNKTISAWVRELSKTISIPNKETFLVGHSIGCQTILRYLEKLSKNEHIGGAVFVAGFLRPLKNHSEEDEINKNWVVKPLDLEKVRLHLNRSVAIFSDDDPYVGVDNKEDFMDRLGSDIVIEHKRGHFSEDTGTFKVPSVLSSVLKLSTKK